jgi:hypothetical protein
MRKFVLFIMALLFVGSITVPASAAPLSVSQQATVKSAQRSGEFQIATTGGKSCQVSPSWTINYSWTYYNGDLAYAVLTSPGPLFYGTNSSVQTRAHAWDPSPGYHRQSTFGRVGTGTNPYTYRANFSNATNFSLAGTYAETYPNSVVCYREFRP